MRCICGCMWVCVHACVFVWVKGSARALSELIKRYKGAGGGGLIPKKFVTGFLWEAAPEHYAEHRLKVALPPAFPPTQIPNLKP